MQNKIFIILLAAASISGFVLFKRFKNEIMPIPQVVQKPIVVQPKIETPKEPELFSETTYEGTWVTGGERKRHLNGTMTAIVTNPEKDKWQGKFFGVWHGSKFSYTVEFSGPPDKLEGKATVDNVNYTWTGKIDKDNFTGTFESPRYDGSFELKLSK